MLVLIKVPSRRGAYAVQLNGDPTQPPLFLIDRFKRLVTSDSQGDLRGILLNPQHSFATRQIQKAKIIKTPEDYEAHECTLVEYRPEEH